MFVRTSVSSVIATESTVGCVFPTTTVLVLVVTPPSASVAVARQAMVSFGDEFVVVSWTVFAVPNRLLVVWLNHSKLTVTLVASGSFAVAEHVAPMWS